MRALRQSFETPRTKMAQPYPLADPTHFPAEPVYCCDLFCAGCCPCVWVGYNADLRAGGTGDSFCNGACCVNCLLQAVGLGTRCAHGKRGRSPAHDHSHVGCWHTCCQRQANKQLLRVQEDCCSDCCVSMCCCLHLVKEHEALNAHRRGAQPQPALQHYPPADPTHFAGIVRFASAEPGARRRYTRNTRTGEPSYKHLCCASLCSCFWVGYNADARNGGTGNSFCNLECFCNCCLSFVPYAGAATPLDRARSAMHASVYTNALR